MSSVYQNKAFTDKLGRLMIWRSDWLILPEDGRDRPCTEAELHTMIQEGKIAPLGTRMQILDKMGERNPTIYSLIEKLQLL